MVRNNLPTEIYTTIESKYGLLPIQLDYLLVLYTKKSTRLPMNSMQIISDVLRLLDQYEKQYDEIRGGEDKIRKWFLRQGKNGLKKKQRKEKYGY